MGCRGGTQSRQRNEDKNLTLISVTVMDTLKLNVITAIFITLCCIMRVATAISKVEALFHVSVGLEAICGLLHPFVQIYSMSELKIEYRKTVCFKRNGVNAAVSYELS